MKLELHYVDPRLVALYDAANPRGADTTFYLRLADRLAARVIVDLGCGTGLLTRALAREGRRVIGVDPAGAMLAVARQGAGAERVEWIAGDSSVLEDWGADLALMTGNVAQVFVDDEAWLTALRNLRRALRPGGHLAFESRNPAARAWEQWNREQTFTRTDTPSGPLEEWLELVSVGEGRVHFQGHNIFLATGEVLVIDSVLRFRTLEELHRSLDATGFTVEEVYGDWQGGPLADASPLIVVVARHNEQ